MRTGSSRLASPAGARCSSTQGVLEDGHRRARQNKEKHLPWRYASGDLASIRHWRAAQPRTAALRGALL